MRAVNLIPLEDRSGRGSARAGALSYVIVGTLVAILAGVTALVLINQDISERQAEITDLEQRRDAAQARADSLRAFADFQSMQEARTATVTDLAQTRFDWERVMRELALVLPPDTWLMGLEGTATPGVTLENPLDVVGRETVPGPALELVGCTVSQEAVGRFAAALRDIDGVTRVTVFNSELPDDGGGTTTDAGSSGSADCRTRDFITRFEIIAAFDEVPVPATATAPPATTAPAAPPAEGETTTEGTTEGESASQGAVQEGVQNGQEAANLAPGA